MSGFKPALINVIIIFNLTIYLKQLPIISKRERRQQKLLKKNLKLNARMNDFKIQQAGSHDNTSHWLRSMKNGEIKEQMIQISDLSEMDGPDQTTKNEQFL